MMRRFFITIFAVILCEVTLAGAYKCKVFVKSPFPTTSEWVGEDTVIVFENVVFGQNPQAQEDTIVVTLQKGDVQDNGVTIGPSSGIELFKFVIIADPHIGTDGLNFEGNGYDAPWQGTYGNGERNEIENVIAVKNKIIQRFQQGEKKETPLWVYGTEFVVAGVISGVGWAIPTIGALAAEQSIPTFWKTYMLARCTWDIFLTAPATWGIGKLLGQKGSLWKTMIGAGIGSFLSALPWASESIVIQAIGFYVGPFLAPTGAVIGYNLK